MESMETNSHVRVGVVTTLKGVEDSLLSFLLYHLTIGVSKIYLFFDDPSDAAIPIALDVKDERIVVIKHEDELKSQWKSLTVYPGMSEFAGAEVQARQSLNAELAMRMALTDDLRWLLHIDSDELFGLAPGMSLHQHFRDLESRGIGQLSYMNHEGVPQAEDVYDPFLEVTLFRQHLAVVPISPESQTAVDFWKGRNPEGQYFLGYDNGKSATRVLPGVIPVSVHSWKLPADCKLTSCSSMPDARNLDLSRVYPCKDAFILHYIVCGFSWYWRKYEMLDSFPNAWFGGKLKIAPCFHLNSRDSYLTGKVENMRQMFRDQVMLASTSEVEAQLAAHVCLRFAAAKELILSEYERRFHKTHPYASDEEAWRAKFKKPEPKDNEALTHKKPADGPKSSINTLSLDKSWMVTQLVSKYLQDEFFAQNKKEDQPQTSTLKTD